MANGNFTSNRMEPLSQWIPVSSSIEFRPNLFESFSDLVTQGEEREREVVGDIYKAKRATRASKQQT